MDAANQLLQKIETEILNPIVGLMIVVAIVFFIYGLIEFIGGSYNEEKRENGKRHMIWGAVGLFIMISVFGLIRLADIFGGLG